MKNNLGLKDIWLGSQREYGEQHQQRHRIASAMNGIMDSLIRLDATPEQLSAYADRLEALQQDLAQHGRMDQLALYKKFAENQGTEEDALNIVDFDLFVGRSTPLTLPLDIWVEGEKVHAKANLGMHYQGPPGRVHGGIVAAIFDVLLAHTQQITHTVGFTGSLSVRYRAATPLNTDLTMEAWITETEGRKLFNKGVIKVGDEITAEATGIWIQAKENMMLG